MANMTKFPNGMGHVADQIHSLGLGFGMYSSAGKYTCGKYRKSKQVVHWQASTDLGQPDLWAMKLRTHQRLQGGALTTSSTTIATMRGSLGHRSSPTTDTRTCQMLSTQPGAQYCTQCVIGARTTRGSGRRLWLTRGECPVIFMTLSTVLMSAVHVLATKATIAPYQDSTARS